MTLIKVSLTIAVLAVTGWLSYSSLTGISDADIYAFHRADYRTVDRKLQPGSIAAVSPQENITEICSLAHNKKLSPEVETAIYYNQLKEDFPAYVGSIKLFLNAVWKEGSENSTASDDLNNRPISGREFTGESKEIKDLQTATEFSEPDCEVRMAWHLSHGYKVCTVRKALNAAVLQADGSIEVTTVAVAFAEHSSFVGESTFKKADYPYNNAAKLANGQPCAGSSLPLPAKVRRSLGIIQRIVPEPV